MTLRICIIKRKETKTLNHLKSLYPESRAAKKREELDRLATQYTITLCSYLPCIDHASATGQGLADDMLTLLKNIVEVQSKISGLDTQPLQGDEPEQLPSGDVTDAQWEHIKRLSSRYGIGIFSETNEPPYYVSHPTVGENAYQATSEPNLYEYIIVLVNDIKAKENQ